LTQLPSHLEHEQQNASCLQQPGELQRQYQLQASIRQAMQEKGKTFTGIMISLGYQQDFSMLFLVETGEAEAPDTQIIMT